MRFCNLLAPLLRTSMATMSPRFPRALSSFLSFHLFIAYMNLLMEVVSYIIWWQHVLEKGKEEERNQIIEKLASQVVSMSQNKYASNVIEKCFQCAGPTHRDILIRHIIQQTDGNDALLVCIFPCFLGSSFYPSQCIYISLIHHKMMCFVLFCFCLMKICRG